MILQAVPKLLLRETGSSHVIDLERYMRCPDLAQQRAACTSRTLMANSRSLQTALSNIESGLVKPVRRGPWDFSGAERAWTMERPQQMPPETAFSEKSRALRSILPTHHEVRDRGE
jgi:hypothetical protein